MNGLFYPECPTKSYFAIEAIFDRLGYGRTGDPDADYDFAVLWQRRTWMHRQPLLERLAERIPVINLGCLDISKRRVDRVFSRVFGYALSVDPTRFEGRAVKKRDEDSVHGEGGFLVDCPISRRAAADVRYVYQRFIDTVDRGRVLEVRVPVILGRIPEVHVLEKLPPAPESLKTATARQTVVAPGDVFSERELERILAFARGMGLDVGEIDTLRDPRDGRLYLLDANKNPSGYERVDPSRQCAAFELGLRERGLPV